MESKLIDMLKSYFQKILLEAGCDEAGRGPLAGPVFAAAVILPKNYKNKWLNDSKKLKEHERNELRKVIEHDAADWAVAQCNQQEIDKWNILVCSHKAMHRAIDKLKTKPKLLLIDGNRFTPYPTIKHECIIKGDAQYMSIAAASILAKTYRDEYMERIAKDFPQYDWQQNKGYPTLHHKQMIAKFGLTPHHRKTFNWRINEVKELF